jgi:predicted nucleotide-binding protein (sugar kinase/HSP70/actin superfamily)
MIEKINNTILRGKKDAKNSTFYSIIHPDIEYSKQELFSLLKKAGYQQPSSYFSSIANPSNIYTSSRKASYGGFILNITHSGKYKIRDELKVCWKS